MPVVEGLDNIPTSDEIKHFGAAMASYGSTPLFHLVGITPEAQNLTDCGGDKCRAETITADDIEKLGERFSGHGDKLDVVVFAALNYLSLKCSNWLLCASVQPLKCR